VRVASQVMPPRDRMDPVARERIAAWLRYYKHARGWTNERLADELGVAEPTVTNVMNAMRSAGLDLVIKMHRKLGRSMDDFVDSDPPSTAGGASTAGKRGK
jgi:transcriptional regulator with XRE-family HTH domain